MLSSPWGVEWSSNLRTLWIRFHDRWKFQTLVDINKHKPLYRDSFNNSGKGDSKDDWQCFQTQSWCFVSSSSFLAKLKETLFAEQSCQQSLWTDIWWVKEDKSSWNEWWCDNGDGRDRRRQLDLWLIDWQRKQTLPNNWNMKLWQWFWSLLRDDKLLGLLVTFF